MTVEYGPRGRWGGRLTRRALPELDPSIDELGPRDRERLAEIWLHRARMERRVADSFEVIRAALVRQHAAPELVALAERAIDDEFRHTELSRVVASRFAGCELALSTRLELNVPVHAGASPELRDTLHIVGQCLLNETTASAYLEVTLAHAGGALARAAVQELLSDEIDHARIGWAHLASLDRAARNAVGPWLLPMAYLNLRTWLEETPVDPGQTAGLAAHGAPAAGVVHEALLDALKSVIVPGLAALELPTRSLERWLAAGAFTDRPPREFS
jgi:hypothetical protein